MRFYSTMRAQQHALSGEVSVTTQYETVAVMKNDDMELAAVFAASLDMLDALEELVEEFDQKESVHIPWRMARAAIKKAKQLT